MKAQLLEAIRGARADVRNRVWELAGEPVAAVLRPGNAGSNTASDHIEATRLALVNVYVRS